MECDSQCKKVDLKFKCRSQDLVHVLQIKSYNVEYEAISRLL